MISGNAKGYLSAGTGLLVATLLVGNSAQTWFSEPTVEERNGGIFICGMDNTGVCNTDRYDIATRLAVRKANPMTAPEVDDHDNGCLVFTNSGILTRYYCAHVDTTIRFRVTDIAINSAANWAAASFSTETFLFTPAVDNTRYSYSNAFKLSQTGDRVYFLCRKGLDPDPQAVCQWILLTIDNAHTTSPTVSGQLVVMSNPGQFPYAKFRGNGVDRIDMVTTDVVSPSGAASLYHGYLKLDGSNVLQFYNSAGTLQTGPFTPSNATLVKSGATQLCWMSDIILRADGNPSLCTQQYPSNDDTAINAYCNTYKGGSWNNVLLIAEGSGMPVSAGPTQGRYPGAHVFVNDDKIITSANVAGTRQMIPFTTSDGGTSWNQGSAVTSGVNNGAGQFRFRPSRVQNSSGFANYLWHGDSVYNGFDSFNISRYAIA